MKVIGIHGRARSGKDSVADRLCEEHGFVRIAFADPLYAMLAIATGLSEDYLRSIQDKEAPLPAGGMNSLRYLLQELGSGWGRDKVHSNLWVNRAALEFTRVCATKPQGVVFSDVRLENEADYVRGHGGVIWCITRVTSAKVRAHESEAGIRLQGRDRGIVNDGTLEQLHARVDELLRQS